MATVLNHFDSPASNGDNVAQFDGTVNHTGTANFTGTTNINGTLNRYGVPMQAFTAGNHVVTAGEQTALSATFATGFTTITSIQIQVVNSSNVEKVGGNYSWSGGNITVTNAGGINLMANDVIRWVAFGTA